MSLSNLLRVALHGCKVRPSFGICPKITPVSSVGYHSLLYKDRQVFPEKKIAPISLSQLHRFSTTVPKQSSHADHAKLWTWERAVSLALLGILPAGVIYPNVLFDLLMAVSLVMHNHWGIEAIAADYIRPSIFGPVIPKIAMMSVYVFSVFLLVGLLNLIFNNAGLGNSIKLLWKI